MKKFVWLLMAGAVSLTLILVGCGGGGGSSSLLGGSVGGGASKAPIIGGAVYLNGIYSGDTDSNGNFTVSATALSGFASSDYPLTVEIRGGRTNLRTYSANTVVLDGYMYEGDPNVYLSVFSMMKKRWIDGGLSLEAANSRATAVFNTVANLVGYDFGSVNANSNPAENVAFEIVQQSLLTYLGEQGQAIDEASTENIGNALGTALGAIITDSTAASNFNTDLANIATAVINNRQNILSAAGTAFGTTVALDETKILNSLVGLNVWSTQNAGTNQSQAGTLYVDVNGGGTLNLDFHFDWDVDPGTGGLTNTTVGGALELTAATGAVAPSTAYAIRLSSAPTMDNLTVTLDGTTAITSTTDLNNHYVRLAFARGSMTNAQKWAAIDAPLTISFYAADNTTISQSYTIRFYDSTNMSTVTSVDFSNTTLTAATYNFGASTLPLFINSGDSVDIGNGSIFDARVAYTGANNLSGAFVRFLAPEGFKFNRASGWTSLYRNLDIKTITAGGSPQTVANVATSTDLTGSGNFSLVADSAQPVGSKAFTVEVKDKTSGQVLATSSKSVYFTTTDSLSEIAAIDIASYGGDTTPNYTVTGGAANVIGPDLGNFVGTVKTWGTLSTQHANCSTGAGSTVRTTGVAATSSWALSVWTFNSSASAGWSYDGSTWNKNLDVMTSGSAIDSGTVAIADDCTLTINPGSNSRFMPYYVSGHYNRDKVSVTYTKSGTGGYTTSSDYLEFTQ